MDLELSGDLITVNLYLELTEMWENESIWLDALLRMYIWNKKKYDMQLRWLDQTFVFGEGKGESESGWALLQKDWESILEKWKI